MSTLVCKRLCNAYIRFNVAFGKAKRPHGFLKYSPPPGGYSPLADVLVTELVSCFADHVTLIQDHVIH